MGEIQNGYPPPGKGVVWSGKVRDVLEESTVSYPGKKLLSTGFFQEA